uniref:LysM and putative peptidoglycan-binding domain-containing protein 2 n=2 Tax=Cacopsylla melanoneura TaxID=428564 RepID=A0A8D8WLL4_9HEMI
MDERVSIRDSAKSLKKYGATNCNSNFKRPETYIKHMISSTDTLQGIALKYGVTTEQIRRTNRLWANDSLFLRESLLIPVPLLNGSDTGSDSLITSPNDVSLFDISECSGQFLNYSDDTSARSEGTGRSSTNPSRSSSFVSDSGTSGISSTYNGGDSVRNSRSVSNGDLKSVGGHTSASNGAGYDPDAYNAFLVRIDCDIASTKSQVIQATGKSQFRPQDDDCIFLSKRRPMSRRKQQQEQQQSSLSHSLLPSVITQGPRIRNSMQKLQESHDELFEL